MNKSQLKYIINPILLIVILFILICCNEKNRKDIITKETKVKYNGIIGNSIDNYEKLIPNSIYDSNYIVLWRTGSIYFSEYSSCLIIEKKQLKDNQIICHYMTFEYEKPSNFRNWKLTNVYELTLENIPFKFPLKNKSNFNVIDSLCFDCKCEGIKANVYFIKEFNSKVVYPIHRKYNKYLLKNIEYLFKQISKKEHVQTLSLIKDSIYYKFVNKLMNNDSITYCLEDNGNAGRLQRRYGDK